MKPTTIEHPLRTITLEYKGEQDLSPLESKTLEVYIGLHGTLDSLKKRLSKLNGRLFKLELDLKKCIEDRLALEQEVRKTGPVAGYSYEECLSFEIPEDTEIELNEIINQALEFQEIVNNLYEDTQVFAQDFQVWDTDLELFDESLKSFQENNANPIIGSGENVEIVTDAFDLDIQEFLEVYNELVFENRKMFMENHNTYVLDYNDEIKNIQLIYSRIEKISDFMASGELEENN